MQAKLPRRKGPTRACLIVLCLLAANAWSGEQHAMEPRMAADPEVRVARWHELLRQPGRDAWDTLISVNRFFNQLRQQDDRLTWGKDDYWASPEELLRAGAGDCEDFAIAKYQTLIALGIHTEQLRLVTTRAYSPRTRTIERHMVLTYQPSPGATVWVLDNLIPNIVALDMRHDLARIQNVSVTMPQRERHTRTEE